MLSPKERPLDTTSPLPGLEAPKIAPDAGARPTSSRVIRWIITSRKSWCSRRLFEVEPFEGAIVDPACGWGTIVTNALIAGHVAAGFDLVDRGWDLRARRQDFLTYSDQFDNIVTNPPFGIIKGFITHAVSCSRRNTAADPFPWRGSTAALLAAGSAAAGKILVADAAATSHAARRLTFGLGGKVGRRAGSTSAGWFSSTAIPAAPELAWLHREGAVSSHEQPPSSSSWSSCRCCRVPRPRRPACRSFSSRHFAGWAPARGAEAAHADLL